MSVLIFISVLVAFLLDYLLGEAKRFHPLVGFGNYALWLEKKLNFITSTAKKGQIQKTRLLGVLAWLLAVLPITAGFYVLQESLFTFFSKSNLVKVVFSGFILYLCIGWKSLLQHAMNIATPLINQDLAKARVAVFMIVSRDTQSLDEQGIAKAATESVLENGGDAIFSALFWFLLLGVPGVVMYRLSNTLDAMWGYKNKQFLYFGWCAARIDDALNFIPARLTALSYALMGHTKIALRCWRLQGMNWKSPNAGPVMAAGAGALNVSLGGAAQYHNQLQHRPDLGPSCEDAPQVTGQSIVGAYELVNKALALWIFVLMVMVIFTQFFSQGANV
jgi:adenosylcobinamide-phosphate synthase